MTPFFITGLPRSRTAWLAVASTTGNSICHHEPGFGDYESARDIWQAPSEVRVGISDAGLGLHIRRIVDDIAPRVLIVDRDLEAVLASFERYAGMDLAGSRDAVRDRLWDLRDALEFDHPLIRRVRFEDLTSQSVVTDCMAWLGVTPLNLPQLMHLNIQSDLGFNLAKLRAQAA